MTIQDTDVVSAADSHLHSQSYRLLQADQEAQVLAVHFAISGREDVFGARLPLPSSDEVKPFLYAPPRDAADYLDMVRIWLEEEVSTGCAKWAARFPRDGVVYFRIERYGFRREDPIEHVRLLAAIGA